MQPELANLFAMVAKTKALKLKNPMQRRGSLKIHMKISDDISSTKSIHVLACGACKAPQQLKFPWETDARKSHHSIHTQPLQRPLHQIGTVHRATLLEP